MAMEIKDRIRQARKLRKMSQTELGAACGYGNESQARISHYETGRRAPTLVDLKTIAEALDMTVLELIAGAEQTAVAARLAGVLGGLTPAQAEKLAGLVEEIAKEMKAASTAELPPPAAGRE